MLALPITVSAAEEKTQPDLGMWSWFQSAFITDTARKDILDFCIREGISHIDQHISIKKRKKSYFIENAEELKKLIIDAGKRNISVNVLRGNKHMFFEPLHSKVLEQLATVIEFDQQLPKKVHLSGIKYDVEPYLTTQWKAGWEKRKKVIQDYLVLLQKAKELLDKDAPHLELSVDVPFWWDNPEFAILFNGQENLFTHHIQDLTDWIAIMSYRTTSREVLKLVKTELTYAKQTGRSNSIAPGLETAEVHGEEYWTSFWETPPEKFRKTLEKLRQELSGNPAVRCIMIHHYKSLVNYLEQTPATIKRKVLTQEK
ncbi:MAG: hypothetical protein GKR87_06395 [Kiritimatiellae bacterium]|nr:hypothetical protein [Kiritimatiellia bacterium]